MPKENVLSFEDDAKMLNIKDRSHIRESAVLISCLCTALLIIPPHVVACRIACRCRARLRTSAARVCAQDQRVRHRAQPRGAARAWRAAPARDSRACQPSPRVWPGWPGQNRSGRVGRVANRAESRGANFAESRRIARCSTKPRIANRQSI